MIYKFHMHWDVECFTVITLRYSLFYYLVQGIERNLQMRFKNGERRPYLIAHLI